MRVGGGDYGYSRQRSDARHSRGVFVTVGTAVGK